MSQSLGGYLGAVRGRGEPRACVDSRMATVLPKHRIKYALKVGAVFGGSQRRGRLSVIRVLRKKCQRTSRQFFRVAHYLLQSCQECGHTFLHHEQRIVREVLSR